MASEYFISSDPAAIVESTKNVLYLEDEDVAHISEGSLYIHRLSTDGGIPRTRAFQMLELQLQEIMKRRFDHLMQKEIFE